MKNFYIDPSTSKYKNKSFVQVEPLEQRVLLSAAVQPSWSEQFPSPPNPPLLSGQNASYPVSIADPINGDLIVAELEASPESGPDASSAVMAFAAFKNDGAGGLVLDTSFGNYSNDSGLAATPGYSFVNIGSLMPGNQTIVFNQGLSENCMAVDSSGNVDIVFQAADATVPEPGDVFLQLAGSENLSGYWGTPNSSFGSGGAPGQSPVPGNYGGNGAEIVCFDPSGNYIQTSFSYTNLSWTPIAIDPLQQDILLGAENAADQYGVIYAFNGGTGAYDTSFGTSGADVLENPGGSDLPGGVTAIACSSGGIYAAVVNTSGGEGTYIQYVTETSLTGSAPLASFGSGSPFAVSGSPGWIELTSVPPDGEGASLGAAIAIDTLNNGDVIIGVSTSAPTSVDPNGIALWRVTSSGGQTTWGPNGDGLTWFNASTATGVTEGGSLDMAVNPSNGDIAVDDSPDVTGAATWISGTSGDQETLSSPWVDDAVGGYGSELCGVAFNATGSVISVGDNSGTLFLCDFDSGPDSPVLLSAVSRRDQGGTDYDINLPVSVINNTVPGVEDRVGGPEDVIMTFANTITQGSDFNVELVSGSGGADGTFGSATVVNGDQLEITLSGATNEQTLVIYMTGLEDATTNVIGSYKLDIGYLIGDVDGLGEVNSIDFGTFAAAFGHSDTQTNFTCDVNCLGEINSIDFGTFSEYFGTGLAEQSN